MRNNFVASRILGSLPFPFGTLNAIHDRLALTTSQEERVVNLTPDPLYHFFLSASKNVSWKHLLSLDVQIVFRQILKFLAIISSNTLRAPLLPLLLGLTLCRLTHLTVSCGPLYGFPPLHSFFW